MELNAASLQLKAMPIFSGQKETFPPLPSEFRNSTELEFRNSKFRIQLLDKLVVYGDGYTWFMTQILQPLIEP